uniref:Uncharacterized protein n=1 Tax=Candidatus Kentrum sp. TC TaxID=2126339 RepID=A0A450YJ54_9GAMM|nr:MAG: hypothetical protein BECKTC1821E_GA0114239_101210 [Candidatus Kentron sp. TC]
MVEKLARRPYEDIEREPRELARGDDAPVLHIGAVWKAKSPLELLTLFGSRITSNQLDRFFSIAQDLLLASDPQLELPDEERYMAQLHGKVHPWSDFLFESVCDSLVKLAVRGPERAGLDALGVEGRVADLVRELLDGADGTRWLSLASHLSALAEAAPEEFLRAVEKSLQESDAPVTRLITETGGSGITERCWHSGLLWALERLAWTPKYLARVVPILVRLSHAPVKGNWSNTPSRSLLGLFRSWLPQTAASLSDRIGVLELLIERDEEVAFGVVKDLLGDDSIGHYSARPKWREDDAGAGRGVTRAERQGMIDAAQERILGLGKGNARRIAALLRTGLWRKEEQRPKVLALMEAFTETTETDEDREILRAALRKRIHWHRNYDKSPTAELNAWLGPVEALYERLAPRDLVIRHRWLFDNLLIDLPTREPKDFQEKEKIIEQTRISALTEIYRERGMSGIEDLIRACAEPGIVGSTLTEATWRDEVPWPEWVVEKGEGFAPDASMTRCISGFLWTLPPPVLDGILRKVMGFGGKDGWDADGFARFLILARVEPETWRLAEDCGPEVRAAYWRTVQPRSIFVHQKEPEFVLERLLEFKRPRTAFGYCRFSIEKVAPRRLFAVLRQLLCEEEPNAPKIDSHYLGEMLKRLENSGEIGKAELIQLEFALFPALGYGRETHAAALYETVMSEPSLFAELIQLCYKPEHGEREESTEGDRIAAEHAFRILYACKRLPGARSDGSIDGEALTHFIDETRERCRRIDRLEACDSMLGRVLAHAPEERDGTWPCAPVGELLERPELEKVRNGFHIGTRNKRGVTCRAYGEGGDQERQLAARYRAWADRLRNSHPNVASMLEGIAKDYEQEGKWRDTEANLDKEGF